MNEGSATLDPLRIRHADGLSPSATTPTRPTGRNARPVGPLTKRGGGAEGRDDDWVTTTESDRWSVTGLIRFTLIR